MGGKKFCLFGLLLLLWLNPIKALASPVHLQVQNAPTGTVLMSVARLGGFNILLADNIGGTVTVNVEEEPANILELIAASQGLLLEKYGNIYVLTPPDKSNALRRVHSYQAKYARPADLAKVAKLSLGEAGKKSQMTKDNNIAGNSAKGQSAEKASVAENSSRVLVDESAGKVVFYGTDAEAQRLQEALQQVDIPAKQVSIEAKVVALSKNAAKNLGVEWEWSKLPKYPEARKTYRHEGRENERVEYEMRRYYNGLLRICSRMPWTLCRAKELSNSSCMRTNTN